MNVHETSAIKKDRNRYHFRDVKKNDASGYGRETTDGLNHGLIYGLNDWREPVWPSGKAVGWKAEGPRFDTASALRSLQKLWFVDTDL